MVSKSQQKRLAIQNPKRKPRVWRAWAIRQVDTGRGLSYVAIGYRPIKYLMEPGQEVIKVRIVEVV